jgi:hypothetical protein
MQIYSLEKYPRTLYKLHNPSVLLILYLASDGGCIYLSLVLNVIITLALNWWGSIYSVSCLISQTPARKTIL